MAAQIRPNRLEVTDRFPMLGLTIRTDGSPVRAEVAVGTHWELFRSDRKAQRTPANFYSSRAASPLLVPHGEAIYVVPPEVLARFVGQDRLYVGLATAPERAGAAPEVAVLPTEGSPYVSLKGLTGRSLKRVRLLPSRQQRMAGYGANGNNALEWAGDAAAPGMEQVTKPNGTTAGGLPAPKQGNGNGGPASPPAKVVEYDDGFGSLPAPSRDEGTSQPASRMGVNAAGPPTAAQSYYGAPKNARPLSHEAVSDDQRGIEGPIPDEPVSSTPQGVRAFSLAAPEYPQAARFAPAVPQNYRSSSSPRTIDSVVIHITDGGPNINGTISWFQNPSAGVSAHYVIGQDGEVVQMVAHNDVAWHARSANSHSIGIEHVANTRGLRPTPAQYCASAALVSWLCDQFGIPADRTHILGHSEADPRTTHTGCPNAVWDWDHYMNLIGSRSCYEPQVQTQALGMRRPAPLVRAQEIITPFYDPTDPSTALTCQNDAFSLAREEWFVGVPNTRIFPHSAICQLRTTAPNGNTYVGTGFYIGPNRVLTCAHNLAGMSSVTIIPGRNGAGNNPFGQHTVSSSSWRIAPSYSGDGDWNNDLAVIDNVPLAAPNGLWFRFLNATPSDRLPIVVCGYSKQSKAVPELTQAIDVDKQHLHGGYATEQSGPEVIEYPILTLKGNSGSPVYHIDVSGSEPQALVCAVHVTGEPAAQGLNRGCFITPAKIDWIEGRTTAFSLSSRAFEIPLDPGVGGMSIGVDALQPADIIVSTARHAVSYAIRAGTLSAVSHAMLYVGNGKVIEAVGSGVREVPIEQAIGDAILAVAYRDSRVDASIGQTIVNYARSRAGNPYNYAGVAFTGYRILNPLPARVVDAIASRLGLEVGQAGTTYCSELVLEAFENAGVPLVASRPGASTPDDLVQLSRSVLAYVGHLKAEDVPLGIPLGLGYPSVARRRVSRAMAGADVVVNGGEVLMPQPPPPRARGLSGGEAAIAIGGFLLETVRDSSGDVTWELDQFANRKHPNDTAPANPAPYKDAATIKLDKWPVSGGTVDDISAWFAIDWQYNGLSLGNVRINNIGTNDAVGWSLHVRAQIMDDNILYEPGGCAALRIRFHYRFNRVAGSEHIAITDVHLYGDGTYETSYRWVQSSTLGLARTTSARALEGGMVGEIGKIIIGDLLGPDAVQWQLDKFEGVKHPNDLAPSGAAAFRNAPTIKIRDWTRGWISDCGADFDINWQYNGQSVANILMSNTGFDDAFAWRLKVRGTIIADNIVYDNRAAVPVLVDGALRPLLESDGVPAKADSSRQPCAAMRVRIEFDFTQRPIGPPHKGVIDIILFGDGTHARWGRWVQDSFF